MSTETAIRLCAATAADAAALAELLIASRKQFLPYAPLAHGDDEVRDWLRDVLLPAGGLLLASVDGEARAFVASARDERGSWIEQLYVAPGWTGQGLGSLLLARVLAGLPRPVRLYCFQANTGARAFYERHGFRAIAFGDGSGNEEGCPDVLYELAA
jgi:GNAT superfamily N-acetyltransferase